MYGNYIQSNRLGHIIGKNLSRWLFLSQTQIFELNIEDETTRNNVVYN